MTDEQVPAGEPLQRSSKKPNNFAGRSYTSVMMSKYLPFSPQMAAAPGANHAESFDCIRAVEGSNPDDGFLRCDRIFAQRLGFLGALAGGKPHLGGRRCLG